MSETRDIQINGIVPDRVARTIRSYAGIRNITIGDVITEMVVRDKLDARLATEIARIQRHIEPALNEVTSKIAGE